jgi:hypothetical protein
MWLTNEMILSVLNKEICKLGFSLVKQDKADQDTLRKIVKQNKVDQDQLHDTVM